LVWISCTAVDAAIAVNAALGFDGTHRKWSWWRSFAIVWDAKTEKLYGLDAKDINDVLF
jgi:gamma-glutamyltranspeptidase/glutathione hydrolase